MKRILLVALIACGSLAAFAAPVPKDAALLPPTEKQLEASVNNLKQIGIAIHSYNDAHQKMPADIVDGDGKILLSWRVLLLPHLEETKLFEQFKLDEPWDSKTNKPLIEKIPKVYSPIRVKATIGETYYQGFNGQGAAFEAGQKLIFPGSFTDGLSNTIAVVEAGEACIWSKPQDLPVDADKPLPKLGGLFDGDFHALFIDGVVKFGHSQTINADEFRKLVTRSDGLAVDHDAGLGTEKK